MTKKQKQAYLNGGYNRCPKCLSNDVNDIPFTLERDDNWVQGRCECHNCGITWIDVFTLTDVQVE